MKKRIFISTIYLELGGIERSLIGLLSAIDYSQYEVDLFLYRHGGDLFDAIPSQVNLLPENKAYSSLYCSVMHAFKQGYPGVAIAKILAKLRSKIFYVSRKSTLENYSQPHYMHKYAVRFLPSINPTVQYDLAIGFIAPFHILRDKVSARRKVGWIHTDYSTIEINADEECPVWNFLDSIASISDDVTTAFLKVFPDLASKIILIENILSPEEVRRQAEAELIDDDFDRDDGRIRLLSIGRFCTAKNFDNVPAICRRLVESGMPVVWYLLGYGPDEALVAKNIRDERMESHVILLGKKQNPYPYIEHCDVYVQASRYEGKAVTVREAQILCKPVVITSYTTSASQVRDGVDGVIVPMDNVGIAEGINRLVNDHELCARLMENLRHSDYGNEAEVYKIYQLCDFG